MAVNRGKQFEDVIKNAFLKVSDVSVDRLHDQTTGYAGSTNICDFIVYLKPYEYYIECKTIHGNTFPFSNITDKQYKGLLEKSKIEGVRAGLIIWWVDKDVTAFVPIQLIQWLKNRDAKSIRYDCDWKLGIPDKEPFTFKQVYKCVQIHGKKKRVFFDYDMERFFRDIDGHTFLHNW